MFSGLPPAQADLHLLELAKDQDMYGIKLSPVKDHEGVPLNLAVIHHGILIFQNHTKVNTFGWIKIRKLSFKRKHFFIKLHQEVGILSFLHNFIFLFWTTGIFRRCS